MKWASIGGHASIVKLLLADPRVDPSESDNWAIRYASRNGHASVLKLLLPDPRVDPSVQDNNAVELASRNDHALVVELLLADHRVVALGGEQSSLESASGSGALTVLQMLMDRPGVVVTKEGLVIAEINEQLAVINMFIARQPHVVSKLRTVALHGFLHAYWTLSHTS